MMRRILFILFFLLGLISQVISQNDPVSSHYMFNNLLYNPGSAGSSGRICATAMTRQQWVGFEGAPSSTLFHVDAAVNPFGIRSGIGITILNDMVGFDKDNALSISYAYLMRVGNGTLGAGINLGMLNKAIDPTWNIPSGDQFVPPSGDPLIPEGKESYVAFDMGFGLFYTTADYWAGISVTHLNEPEIKYQKGTPYVARQFYATAGYTLRLPNPMFEMTPSLFIFTDGRIFQPTVTTIVKYNKKVWGGVGFRAGDALIGMVGTELNNGIGIGYAYDFPLNDIKRSTPGSHEFVVRYCFDLSMGRSSRHYKSIRFL